MVIRAALICMLTVNEYMCDVTVVAVAVTVSDKVSVTITDTVAFLFEAYRYFGGCRYDHKLRSWFRFQVYNRFRIQLQLRSRSRLRSVIFCSNTVIDTTSVMESIVFLVPVALWCI